MATTNARFLVRLTGECNQANKQLWKDNIDAIILAAGPFDIEITWESNDPANMPSDTIFNYFRDQVINNEIVTIGVQRRQ